MQAMQGAIACPGLFSVYIVNRRYGLPGKSINDMRSVIKGFPFGFLPLGEIHYILVNRRYGLPCKSINDMRRVIKGFPFGFLPLGEIHYILVNKKAARGPLK